MRFGLIVAGIACLCLYDHNDVDAGQRTKTVTITRMQPVQMQAVQQYQQVQVTSNANDSPVPLLATESATPQPVSTLQYSVNLRQGVCPCSGTSTCNCSSNCKCRGGNQVSAAASMRSTKEGATVKDLGDGTSMYTPPNGSLGYVVPNGQINNLEFIIPQTMSSNGRTNFGNPAMYNSVDFKAMKSITTTRTRTR